MFGKYESLAQKKRVNTWLGYENTGIPLKGLHFKKTM